MTNNEQKVHELLEFILKQEYTHGSTGQQIEYAQTYAEAAIEHKMVGNTLKVQVHYVLTNLSGWRGKEARETKAKLNKLVKKI